MRITTLNVGVYLLGNMGLVERDLSLVPSDMLDDLSLDIMANNYLNLDATTIIQKRLCMSMLLELAPYYTDVLCTQEDLVVDEQPIFADIYELFGFKAISLCSSHLSMSPVLLGIYGASVKLANVIYVHERLLSQVVVRSMAPVADLDDCGFKSDCVRCEAYPRCAAMVKIREGGRFTTISNVHLCGGRFDDTKALGSKAVARLKLEEVKSLLLGRKDRHIICGDFNSTLLSADYNFGYPGSIKGGPLTDDDKHSWRLWQEGAIKYLINAGYNVVYTDLDKLVPTTSRGNAAVDWIFLRNVNAQSYDIIPMYNAGLGNTLTDHHGVIVDI